MSNEGNVGGVTELAPGDIQRPAPEPQQQKPQAQHVEQPVAPMSGDGQAALQRVGELRQRFLDQSLTAQQRETLAKQISELQRFAFSGGPNPMNPAPDARVTDMRPAGSDLGDSIYSTQGMTPADAEHVRHYAGLKGCDPAQTETLVAVASEIGLTPGGAKAWVDRAAIHAAQGVGLGVELSADQHADFGYECAQMYGGVDKARHEIGLALAFLHTVGAEAADLKLFGSLLYDARWVAPLSFQARCRGLQPVRFE